MSNQEILYVGATPVGDHERGLLLARLMVMDDRMHSRAGTTVTAITARDVQNLCAAVHHLQGCIDKARQDEIVPEPGEDVEYKR